MRAIWMVAVVAIEVQEPELAFLHLDHEPLDASAESLDGELGGASARNAAVGGWAAGGGPGEGCPAAVAGVSHRWFLRRGRKLRT
jgi:hypothetical protein